MKLSRKELDVRYKRIKDRLKKGWSIEDIAKSEGLQIPTKLRGY